MTVAKVIEITAESPQSFEDAIQRGVAKASQTVDGIKSAWVAEQKVAVKDGKVVAYRVTMRVTFVLQD